MSLWNKLKGELIDVIQWTDNSNDTLVYRFERYNNEIKYGAQLTVREGQAGIFVNEGKIADVFAPGMYKLETQNLPILSTLKGWKYGFQSPFKAEVYFVSTRQFTNLKWGTKNPIMLRDAEFGAVRLRAFGTYVIRVTDPAVFLREVVGTDGHFTMEEISEQLRNIVVSRFADKLGGANVPMLDLAAKYSELGDRLLGGIQPEFKQYGLELTKLLVENISLPPEVEEALDKRASMGIVGNMQQFTQFQAANAIRDAANNPGEGGGLASGAMGAGLGFAMGNQISQAMSNPQAQGHGAPPPLPGSNLQFFAAINGQQAGPFTPAVIQQMAQAGQIGRDTLVWRQGMANWTAAGQVAELAGSFAAVPPPLPPQ